MRVLLPGVLALLAGYSLPAYAQAPPVFKSGIELLEIEATVVDSRGQPVGDLKPSEFVVTVDGKPRRVVSAEFVSVGPAPARPLAGAPVPELPVAFNREHRDGRLVVIAIDQFNTRATQARALALALERFLDRLSPDDRVALYSFPGSGPDVDFTADRTVIRDKLATVSGSAEASPPASGYNISQTEAVAVETQSDFESIRRLVWRECNVRMPEGSVDVMLDLGAVSGCEGTVLDEAAEMGVDIHQRSSDAVSGLMTLLRRLGRVEGRKSLILVSEGLIIQNLRSDVITPLSELAAASRVDVNVLLPRMNDGDVERNTFRPTRLEDERLLEEGLEDLAARSRGAIFRATGDLDQALNRIALELSGCYTLGVETRALDRDGARHPINVQVRRKGATVRARREFRYQADPLAEADPLTRLLRAPLSVSDLPIRLATYTFRDGAQNRVVLAAEIAHPEVGSVDLSLGYAVFEPGGRLVTSGRERRTFVSMDGLPVEYDGSLVVPPGNYLLRFAAVDDRGLGGSVEREVHLGTPKNGVVALGDMMLVPVHEANARSLKPRVELRVDARQFATYMQLYSDDSGRFKNAEVVLEVAEDELAVPLSRESVRVQPRGDGRRGDVLVNIPVDGLEPGHYLVRATVGVEGRTVAGSLRPFEVVARASAAALPGPSSLFSGCSANSEAAHSPRWVPFEASFVRTDPNRSRPVAGRFYRASDGSTREETDTDDPERAMISITNLSRCIQYQFVNGRWSSYPVKLPPGGVRPQEVPDDSRRFSPAPAVDGFEVLRFVNAQGIVQFQAPRLDYFPLAVENPAGGRQVFSSVRLGEQPEKWFEPPEGSAVESRSDWRGAVFYPAGR
jgi:VWFA-related protein